MDGNKRTASVSAILALVSEGVIEMPSDLQVRMLGDVALATASGQLDIGGVTAWLRRIFDLSLLPDA